MVAASRKSEKEVHLITMTQRPALEFFTDAQRPDQGHGQVVDLVGSMDGVKELLDEFVMCGDERGSLHEWRMEDSPTGYACRGCGLGVDSVGGSTLVFSEESCRIPWSEWRASVRNMTDSDLLNAMTDSDVDWIAHGRKGWIHSTRPKYAVLGELSVLRREIERRGLDWWTWEGRQARFQDAVRRMSTT